MRKLTVFLCLFLLSFPLFAVILNIPNVQQEQDQWCWAGCSQAIFSYYGISLTQTQIAAYGTDGINTWNWLYGQTTNPTRNGIDNILQHLGQLDSQAFERYLSIDEVGNLITTGRPFVIRWGWDSGGGHFVTGKGLDGNLLYAMDPWYGSETISNYNWFVSGEDHSWTHTLNLITQPSSSTSDVELSDADIRIYCSGLQSDGAVNIFFSLPESRFTRIDIYNLKGQKVKTLKQKVFPKGSNMISWYPDNNASGVYLCRLLTGSHIRLNKILIIR